MNLSFLEDAWEDYLYWTHTDKATLKKINQLINVCVNPSAASVSRNL
jgi:Txe/YoeB family toxin of Txe-Axe toxin-antitoxin module